MTDRVPIPEGLPVITVYDHPTDYPDQYVARKFIGETPTELSFADADLEKVRDWARTRFPYEAERFPRHETDDPVIMETWI